MKWLVFALFAAIISVKASDWTVGTTIRFPGDATDLGEAYFNALFRTSPPHIIKRECPTCSDTNQKIIYYRRLTPDNTWNAYKNMRSDWFDQNNVLNTNFILTNDLDAAIAGNNQFSACNYDDPGIGSFRDCGRNGIIGGQWTSVNKGGHASRFSIYTKNRGKWTIGTTNHYPGDTTNIGRLYFNTLFRKSPIQIIRRECPNCAHATQKTIYYRRLTSADTWNAYRNMRSVWHRDNNILNTDFVLTNDLQKAINGEQEFTYCNYDDFNHRVGAFRDCGLTGYTPQEWTAPNRGEAARFSIYNADECEENIDDCSPNAYCEDTVVSFNCVCKAGFNDKNNDGRICEDINECEDSTSNDCSIYASCTNLIGGDRGYECTCDPGYTDVDGDGTNCVDFDECKAGIRTETGGFEFEDESKFHAQIIPPDEISDIGWSSTGSVVQLRGIIESETKIIGKGDPGEESNQLVGRLSMEESFGTIFCPMVDQTFLVTNVKGLSISITITTECDLKVESWGLHKVYYDIKTQQFLRLENFYPEPRKTDTNYFHHCTDESPCDDDLDNDMDVIAIYEGSDGSPNQITVMHYFDLAGITYISNYMVVEDCIETTTTASGHFAPEIDYNVIYGLYILVLGLYILILGLILWECRKCYINRKGNSPYSKVQVHYVDESSQITDVGVE